MEPKSAKFSAEVDRLVVAAEEDTAAALCQLSLAQQAFDTAAQDLRQRLGQVPEAPLPAAPKEAVVPSLDVDEFGDAAIPDRLLQLFWLLLVAFSMASFSAGFWVGRHVK